MLGFVKKIRRWDCRTKLEAGQVDTVLATQQYLSGEVQKASYTLQLELAAEGVGESRQTVVGW
jgi:hypothetical protein